MYQSVSADNRPLPYRCISKKYSRAGQQGKGTDSCPEIKELTTQKLYNKQKLTSRIISAITQTLDSPKKR